MGQLELVEMNAYPVHGMAVLFGQEVWLTFSRPWWDFASWFWYWLAPGKRKWLLVRKDGQRVRVRAVRVSKRIITVGETT
jgi:hypothetical protein